MEIEELLGSFIRRINRHTMTLPESGQGATIPAPDLEQHYLLYLHIPYCTSLCPFCCFHHAEFEPNASKRYFSCLRQEIATVTDCGYRFDEIYIGGGTPTIVPSELGKTITTVRSQHPIRYISVETNPDHLQPGRLNELKSVGVNRLSVGVQSFDDSLLRAMQRFDTYGSGSEILQRLTAVRGLFDTVNVDMMFNLPQQDETSIRRDLDLLIDDIAADQVSFYPLITSQANDARMSRTMGTTTLSQQKEHYELICERMLSAGYLRSSGWCFSRRPDTYEEYIIGREEYVGLGSGAFSYLKGALYSNTFSIPDYLNAIEAGGQSPIAKRTMSETDQKRYYLLTRLFSGTLDKVRAERRFGGSFQHSLWPELTALKAIDAVKDSGERLRLTERGQYLWVVLMREFFAEANRLS